jgi:hypothetical protein
MRPRDDRIDRLDVTTSLVLAAAVVFYLTSLPHHLGVADESFYLNHARRIREGDVLYRDIFYYVTPVSYWLMAALFWLFGTDIAVARAATAALHAGTAVLVYLTCRRLAVARPLALSAGVAEVALCQSAWPYASYHWPATLLMTAILFAVVRRSWTGATRPAIVPGLLLGALATVQQQKAASMAIGLAAFFVLDAALARRYGAAARWPTAGRQLCWAAAGAALVVLPVLAAVVATAGFAPPFDQLVRLPLTGYRTINQDNSGWGDVGVFSTGLLAFTFPRVLTYLPIVLVPAALRSAAKWYARSDLRGMEQLLALTVLCAAAALATVYKADFIHIALIAPPFLVAWGEAIAALCAKLPPVRWPVWSWATALVLLVGMAVHLERNMNRAHSAFPVSAETPFGRIDFSTAEEARLVERIRALMREVPTREFFAYPMFTSLYLTTGTVNPTPHEVMIPEYNSPAQYAEVVETLDRRRLPYVFACALGADDPVLRYIGEHYERIDAGPHPCGLYRRRGAAGAPS